MVHPDLHVAARDGDLEEMMDLVENKGFNVEERDNVDGLTPLHYAAYYGRFEVVRYLVEQAHADVEAKDNDGWTALHNAVCSYDSRLEVVQYLVEQAHVDIWVKNNDGEIACDRAINPGIIEYLKKMMEDGEVGLRMTKSAAFNPSKKNKIDGDEEDNNNKVDNESTIEPAASSSTEASNDKDIKKQRRT